jgi:hypothetical protein
MRIPSRWSVAALCLLVVLGCAPRSSAQGTPRPTAPPAKKLWIDLSMGPPLVEWFNETARPEDIARADHISQAPLLEEITAGRRLVVFKSAAEAAEAMAELADRVDILGYNIEQGPLNPIEEQRDPLAGIELMRELADRYDLALAVGPDHFFASNYGPELAPYVDLFVIQVQRIQTDPATVRAFVVPLAAALRRANPDIQISVQVRTEGDMAKLAQLVWSLGDAIDGVSVLTRPQSVDLAEELVRMLQTGSIREGRAVSRPRPRAGPSPAGSRGAEAGPVPEATPAGDVLSMPEATTAAARSTPVAERDDGPPIAAAPVGPADTNDSRVRRWLLIAAGVLMVVGMGSGLAAAAVGRAAKGRDARNTPDD